MRQSRHIDKNGTRIKKQPVLIRFHRQINTVTAKNFDPVAHLALMKAAMLTNVK